MQTMAEGWLKVKLMASSGSSRFFLLCRGEVGLHVRGRDAEGFECGLLQSVQLLGLWTSATQVPTCTYLKRHMRASGVGGIVHGA